MPFINSKVNVKLTQEKQDSIKSKLGQAISMVPGKSENWLMLGFEDECKLYFKGDSSTRIAFVEVKIFGSASASAYDKLTEAICNIFNEELEIAKDKIYVKYEEVEHWGWNGANF
ncbi:phenylpyruvate tautomerase MIF-related protein [Anaeromicropila populeti]|uniref:L-dopachrome isomerase n=1 Tax=Anaeromicropila populeti TaxID=37658 RepID=A0A1I6KRD6_9FIRM|nr:phenylpyruvate tautomerase MIF-related protein [Anaeromicropila populeti]SFR93757.1 Macrophage migration inhibitory factor (MIF) [Anaeromicropila populeti]